MGVTRSDAAPSVGRYPPLGLRSTLRALALSAVRALLVGRKVQPINAWIAAFGALAVGIPAISLLMLLGSQGLDPFSLAGLQAAAGWVVMLSVLAAVFGFLPALVVAAPLYAVLAARARATNVTAGVVGALPGLLICPFDAGIGGVFLLYGAPIGVLTHAFALALECEHARLHPREPKRDG